MSGETEVTPSGWTVDTAMVHVQRQLSDLRSLLDERYATQTKALDAAFVASERAVQAALTSAEKAVTKAELASNARFESVNEFRAQLTDQAATFLSRVEAEARLAAQSERLAHLEARLNNAAGADAGAAEAAAARRSATQQTVAIVGAVLIAVSIAVALILGLNT